MNYKNNVLELIGNTPLVKINKLARGVKPLVLAKIESLNPGGSVKDRIGLAMIERAEKLGELKPGGTIVEATSGNTGIGLALACAVKGYRFRVVSSDAFAKEKLQTMRIFGAELDIVPSEGGQITPDLIPSMMQRARTIVDSDPNTYYTNQFYNSDTLRGYEHIGSELLAQVNGPIHAFCGGVGVAGMLMGVARALKRADPDTRIVALEPASSPIITKGTPGTHHVEGLGVGFVPPLLDKNLYDEARGIDEGAARRMALSRSAAPATRSARWPTTCPSPGSWRRSRPGSPLPPGPAVLRPSWP